jgi:hypothetical protein
MKCRVAVVEGIGQPFHIEVMDWPSRDTVKSA